VEPWEKLGVMSIDEIDKSLDDWVKGGEMGKSSIKLG
jgi:hypothetical protein